MGRGLMHWLPEPDPGTSICLGFDGSDVDDWTALRAETRDGFMFTPRHLDGLPTIWDPAEHGGLVPRTEVHLALEAVFERFDVRRLYCDPPRWETDVESWSLKFGEDRVIEWPTYRGKQMHECLDRFVTDLRAGRITHDGCPLTSSNIANARRKMVGLSDRYVLSKPNQAQKIDAAMANALAHEAAADERAAGWPESSAPSIFFLN